MIISHRLTPINTEGNFFLIIESSKLVGAGFSLRNRPKNRNLKIAATAIFSVINSFYVNPCLSVISKVLSINGSD